MRTIDSLWARFLWSPVKSKMPEIYQTFNQRYNPETNLQTLLQTFMTNEDGYLKFYLTFIGQDRENNFFPMPAGFTEQSLVRLCRQNGCVFQIPVLANKDNTHVFDIGPTINILPNQESNKYLKNF